MSFVEPESDTPETDAASIAGHLESSEDHYGNGEWCSSDFARSLERRLTQAEESRKFREANMDRIMKEEATAQRLLKDKLKQAQARVAELEKAIQAGYAVGSQYDTDLPQPGDEEFKRGATSVLNAIKTSLRPPGGCV